MRHLVNHLIPGCYCRDESPKKPDRKSQKISPEAPKKVPVKKSPAAKTPKATTSKKQASSPAVKTPKAAVKVASPSVKSESPENKPLNGQSKEEIEEPKDESKTLKIQSAGAGLAGADYNPSKKKYHPVDDAFWKHGEK